jgi:ABC-type transport system substrate-binding protein
MQAAVDFVRPGPKHPGSLAGFDGLGPVQGLGRGRHPCGLGRAISRLKVGFEEQTGSEFQLQIKEIVGSGPFKFARDDWQPGEQVVYVRNADYIPRDETPSGSTGGKKVHLDKVIWRYIPDPWDAADDLVAGKVDWWQEPSLDFIPKIESSA